MCCIEAGRAGVELDEAQSGRLILEAPYLLDNRLRFCQCLDNFYVPLIRWKQFLVTLSRKQIAMEVFGRDLEIFQFEKYYNILQLQKICIFKWVEERRQLLVKRKQM